MKTVLPLSLKVPAVAAIFVVAVSVFISQQVLSKLESIQREHLETLATVHLDGLSSALSDAALREDVWEVFAILDRSRQGMQGVKAIETVVTNSDGVVIAASDPRSLATGTKLPWSYINVKGSDKRFYMDEATARGFARRDILYNGQPIGAVYATLDISELLADRSHALAALVATNAFLTVISIVAVWLTVHRMMRPVDVLASHLERGSSAQVEPIDDKETAKAGQEFRRLFLAFNSMAGAINEREQLLRRISEEEKLASLGKLASGVAHEINNPLGGIFNALDTLKHHGDKPDVQRRSIDLIERGLRGIRDIVRSTLMTWRGDREGRVLEIQDLEDLRILTGPDLKRKELLLDWNIDIEAGTSLPASHIRQMVLNLLLNACRAAPMGGHVGFKAVATGKGLEMEVSDDGPGMPEFARKTLTASDTAPSPSASGHGLGLWATQRLIRELGGTVEVDIEVGTVVTIVVPEPGLREIRDAA